MARRVLIIDSCDPCEHYEIPDVPAAEKHTLSLDGGPVKEIAFCGRCMHQYGDLLEIIKLGGQEVAPATFDAAPSKVGAKTRPKSKAQLKDEQLPIEEKETKPASKKAGGKKKERLEVLCPLKHVSTGGPLRVSYEHRGSHADNVHDGLKVWQIKWQDPDGVLKAFCQKAPCDGLGYTSTRSLHQHEAYAHSAPSTRTDDGPQGTA